MAMQWKQADGRPAPVEAVAVAQAASAEFGVPVLEMVPLAKPF